jgi:hypothetical protein
MSSLSFLLFPILTCLCFVTVLVIVGGGIFLLVRHSVAAMNRTWADLGVRTGLTLKPAAAFSQPELNGEFRRRPLRVYVYTSGGRRNRTTYTAVALTVNNPANARLEITPSGTMLNFFGKMLNAQDVQIGNPAFDARFVIKSNPPEFAMNFLGDARVQTEIMEIPDVFRIELEGPSLRYSKHGLEENADFLTKLFNTMSDLADRLEGN